MDRRPIQNEHIYYLGQATGIERPGVTRNSVRENEISQETRPAFFLGDEAETGQ